MSDRAYTVLAFIGFVILAIIYMFNVEPREASNNIFNVGDYYAPNSVSSAENAAKIYKDLSGGKYVQCPVTELKMSEDDIAYCTSMYITTQTNKYDNICFFTTFEGLDKEYVLLSMGDYESLLGLKSGGFDVADTVKFADLFSMGDEVIEIIAPFKFNFTTINTVQDRGNLEIINSRGNVKISFSNVSNWFCAGAPGTSSENNEGTDSIPEDWSNHTHNSIIGNSENATVMGGQAGQVIGYANAQTTVTIYRKDSTDKDWVQISVKEWLESK